MFQGRKKESSTQPAAAPPPPSSTAVYLLTGDIGGTNSRMSLYALNANNTSARNVTETMGATKATVSKTYRNALQYPSSDVLQQEDAFIQYVLKPFLAYCWDEEQQRQEMAKNSNTEDNDAKPVKPPPVDGDTIIVCCIASAGAVANNQVRLTNLGNLLISGSFIEEDSSNEHMACIVKCVVINDFVAQGYGCLTLKQHEVKHLFGPDTLTTATGPKVCVGAGTGLGECFLTQSQHAHCPNQSGSPQHCEDEPYSCFPSEGGHVDFSPHNSLEVELYQYLSQKFCSKHRISVERIVSGKGLANVYEFLAYRFPDQVDPKVHQEFLEAGDEQGRVVAQNARKTDSGNACSLCQQAMSIMITAYGYEVGSAAIKFIPTGGLFVSGGLTPKNIAYIEGLQTDFMVAYRNKGRVSPLLDSIPLYAVMTEDLGVRGAHKAALVAFQSYCNAQRVLQAQMALQLPMPLARRESKRMLQLVQEQQQQHQKGENVTKVSPACMVAGVAISSALLTAATSVYITLLFQGSRCRSR